MKSKKVVCIACRKAHSAGACHKVAVRRPQRFVQRALAYQRLLMERATG